MTHAYFGVDSHGLSFFVGSLGCLPRKSPVSKDLREYTKEELLNYIKTLKKAKKFGLVWEDKPERVVKDVEEKLPVLEEVADRAITTGDDSPTHLIIEGDNYHSLSVLNYTHTGKIDLIYIDPPYNTGSKDFVYNDHYVDNDDAFRHSKWLSFISKRLHLAKNLLSDTGVVFISIDDNEQAHLRLLCDQIFGTENFVATFIIDKTAQGANQSLTFKTQHEFLLMYAKSLEMVNYDVQGEIDAKKYKYKDDRGAYAITNSFDSINSPLVSNKRRGYTVYYDEHTGDAQIKDEYNPETNTFGDYDNTLLSSGYVPIRPGVRKNIQYPWNWQSSRFISDYKKDLVFMKNKKGEWGIYHKNRATGFTKDTTIKRFDTRKFGNQILNEILGEKLFDYPKSLDMMEWVISKYKNSSATILDFFAGSGTTGHAVLKMNAADGGRRQFILGTNNENGIAENITYERIKRVSNGYGENEPINANVRYFKTAFVERDETLDKLRRELSPACDDMIRIREGAYEVVADEPNFKVYKNQRGLTAVVYDRFELASYVSKIEALETDSPVHLYVFSYDKSVREQEMPKGIKHTYESQPIPEGVLEIYRKIFRKDGVQE